MQSSSGDDDGVMSDINVTPLVDVMLVLLVVFIVTAPLLTNAITVDLPQTAESQPPEQAEAVVVSVDASGRIFVDRTEHALEAVEPTLAELHRQNPDVLVHLNADEGCNYGVVARVMSAADRAGIVRLSVLTAVE
jgi:biopolymer transport protein ExbD